MTEIDYVTRKNYVISDTAIMSKDSFEPIFKDGALVLGQDQDYFGKHGGGTPEMFGLEGQIDVISSTLGKALGGGTGGYTAGSKEVVGLLR